MINIHVPFVAFVFCEVLYDGRASSTLEAGNYLIIFKADGSIQIQAGNKIAPRNYQQPGAKLELRGHVLIIRRKHETIKIIIHKLHQVFYPQNWSCAEIVIIRTERDLVNKLFANWSDYIEGNFATIQLEFATPLGPIDLAGVDATGCYHLVEVKRKGIIVPNISQLNRYVSAMRDRGELVAGYIAAPRIGDRARDYCESLGFKYIFIDF